MSATRLSTENIQTTISQINNDFSGREGDLDYNSDCLVHIHRRNRPYVWNKDMQENLIDSIINGYFIPPIICCSRIVDGRERREVMEGGNRMTTFRRILRGDVRELTTEERQRIESHPITIVVMRNLTAKAQRIMFRRLNKNVKVSDGQLYAMSVDDSPLVREAVAFLDNDDYPLRNIISEHFFDTRNADTNGKKNLENAIALISGALNGVHFITKSYNVQECQIEKQDPIHRDEIIRVLGHVFEIFTIANTFGNLPNGHKRRSQWNIGKWLGSILYDIHMAYDDEDIAEIQQKWAKYIVAVRRGDDHAEDASKLSGAQNLTATRYCRICAKVNIYMSEKRIASDNELLAYVHRDLDPDDDISDLMTDGSEYCDDEN